MKPAETGRKANGKPKLDLSVPDEAKSKAVAAVQQVPDEEKAGVAAAAVGAVPDASKADVATAAIHAVPDSSRADVAAAAVRAAPDADKAGLVDVVARQLPADAQQALAERLAPDQAVTNQIWLVIVRTFAIVLIGATLALVAAVFVSFWRTVDMALVQILLTVFTTIAGILAGFVSGRASTPRVPREVH